jgi:hypothetical protein
LFGWFDLGGNGSLVDAFFFFGRIVLVSFLFSVLVFGISLYICLFRFQLWFRFTVVFCCLFHCPSVCLFLLGVGIIFSQFRNLKPRKLERLQCF